MSTKYSQPRRRITRPGLSSLQSLLAMFRQTSCPSGVPRTGFFTPSGGYKRIHPNERRDVVAILGQLLDRMDGMTFWRGMCPRRRRTAGNPGDETRAMQTLKTLAFLRRISSLNSLSSGFSRRGSVQVFGLQNPTPEGLEVRQKFYVRNKGYFYFQTPSDNTLIFF